MANYFEYKGYHTRIEFDHDDQVLYGKIEGINDLVSFEADNGSEIESAFHEAVDDYLSFCEELGKEPNKEFKGSFNVRITPELHRRAANKAFEGGISLNQFIQNAIENELNGRYVNNYQLNLIMPYNKEYPIENSVDHYSFNSEDIVFGFSKNTVKEKLYANKN